MALQLNWKLIVFILYVAFLSFCGFRKRIGFAGWYMFADVSKCGFDLKESSQPFNVWDYLPHSYLAMNRDQLQFFLFYLKEVKGISVDGEVTVREGFDLYHVHVRGSDVVE